MLFHENLRACREKAGYTAKELSKRIGVKYTTYVGYETQGREPKFETLCKIADALQVSTDELLGHKLDKYGRMFQELERLGFTVKDTGTNIDIESKSKGTMLYNKWTFQTKEDLYKVFLNAEYIADGIIEGLIGDLFKTSLISGFNNYMTNKVQEAIFTADD